MDDEPYEAPTEHLRDETSLTRLLLTREIARAPSTSPGLSTPSLGELEEQIRSLVATIVRRLAQSRARGQPMPCDRLRAVFGLSARELRVLTVLTVLEMDADLRELARFVAADSLRSQPDVALLKVLVYEDAETQALADLRRDAPLFRFALLQDLDASRETAFVLRRVRCTERILELAHGFDRLDLGLLGLAELATPPATLELLDGQRKALSAIGQLMRTAASTSEDAKHPIILVNGAPTSGRKALTYTCASELNLRVLRVRCERLPSDEAQVTMIARLLLREAMWFHAVLLLDGIDDAPAIDLDRTILGNVNGPIVATARRDHARSFRFDRGVVNVPLEPLEHFDRATMWRAALDTSATDELVEWVATRYTLTPGRILSAGASARASVSARGSTLTREDLHDAVRSVLDASLSTLGSRIAWRQQWSDVVLPEETMLEIRELISRVAHRRQVYDDWGFGTKLGKGLGVTALFTGMPGTGKTMVAGLIASELGLDLYQVDLSRIVSKWVGETEKNLASLFDAAEVGHAILLFDEADSLFAKRTEVTSSVDRYANLEVNYLLQRMEAFRGISILTTNHDTAIDDAFRRRLSCRIEFPVPEEDERLGLWRGMLPDAATQGQQLDLERLADRYVMSGGYIRNAVLRAAFMAADQGTAITMEHLLRAANLEYAGFGKVMI